MCGSEEENFYHLAMHPPPLSEPEPSTRGHEFHNGRFHRLHKHVICVDFLRFNAFALYNQIGLTIGPEPGSFSPKCDSREDFLKIGQVLSVLVITHGALDVVSSKILRIS